MKRYILVTLLLMSVNMLFAQVKVACIGNSITYGSSLKDPASESYPTQLQAMLGDKYVVKNFGEPGATLLYKGHSPYIKRASFPKALAFVPDIAVIHLGINDTDPRNWPCHGDEFVQNYLSILDSLKSVNPDVRIIIARMTPIFDGHTRFNSGTKQWHAKIQEKIELVAKVSKSELIDFYYPFLMRSELFNDVLHPNIEGAGVMADIVYKSITGNYGGLQMSMLYSDNMVIQKDRPITINGVANSGDKVTVSLSKYKASVVTSTDGKWSVTFPAFSEPKTNLTLSVSTNNRKLIYKNVCIGEVWICSGQSNMQFKLGQSSTSEEDFPLAKDENLRLFNMKPFDTGNYSWSSSVVDSINSFKSYYPASWQCCTPETAKDFSAIAYYFGKMLRDSLKMPVGLILNAVGGSPQESWIDRTTLENEYPLILRDWTNNDFTQKWCRERAKLNMYESQNTSLHYPIPTLHHPYEPGYLFESGVRPLGKLEIQGVIWYQGESNEHCYETFEDLFRIFVKSCRRWYNRNDLPIYYVQLSSMNRTQWPWVRDMQRRMVDSLDYVGMAVSSDLGEENDVHPKVKKPIGERLARLALNRQYNRPYITVSGPTYNYVEQKDGKAILSFNYSEGLKTSDGKELRTFEVAKYDGLFYPANAQIQDGRVVLSSPKVDTINYIRYGWKPYSDANLVNGDNLPASTFRLVLH